MIVVKQIPLKDRFCIETVCHFKRIMSSHLTCGNHMTLKHVKPDMV